MRAARPPVLLVLAVLALHLLAGREVLRIHEGWVSEGPPPMPARMRVEFVREMLSQTPPAARALPPARPAAVPAAVPAAGPVAAPQQPASAPETKPDAAASSSSAAHPVAVAAAASAPAESPSPGVLADAASPDAEPGPEWPLSTRLSYQLTGNSRGPVSGQAQVEWLRKGADYQMHLDVGIGPSFAPLVTRRMSSEGRLTPGGVSPRAYDENTQVIFSEPKRYGLAFLGGDAPTITQADGSVQYGVQDAASQFVQLTWLFLTGREPMQVGRVVRFPLRLPSGAYEWQYESVGEEVLHTPMGPLAAWHLKPRQAARGGDMTADVWLAPTLQFLPVRLLIRQNADTYLDLMLKSAPLQAAPESDNGIPRRLSQ